MQITTYTDLFEDEVAEILRELTSTNTSISYKTYTYKPACTICDDGIYTSGKGYFTEYYNGKYTGNHVGTGYLIRVLAHTTFTVKEV